MLCACYCKALVDPFAPARTAALHAISAVAQQKPPKLYWGDLSKKLIPAVSNRLDDPDPGVKMDACNVLVTLSGL